MFHWLNNLQTACENCWRQEVQNLQTQHPWTKVWKQKQVYDKKSDVFSKILPSAPTEAGPALVLT